MIGMKTITNLVVGLRATSLKIATIKSMSLLLGMAIRRLDLNRKAHRELIRSVNYCVQSFLPFLTSPQFRVGR